MGHGCARKVKADSRAFGLSASEMALGKMVGGAGLGNPARCSLWLLMRAGVKLLADPAACQTPSLDVPQTPHTQLV